MRPDLYKSHGLEALNAITRAEDRRRTEDRRRRDYMAFTMGMTGMVGIGFLA
jgi:hypothetical protein